MSGTGTIGVKPGNVIVPVTNLTKQTKWLDVSSALTGTISWAYARFYLDTSSPNIWRMDLNAKIANTGSSTFTGVTFKSVGIQYIAGVDASTGTLVYVGFGNGTSTIALGGGGSQATSFTAVGILLNTEPLTYTTAANMENAGALNVYIPFGQTGSPGEIFGTVIAGTGGSGYEYVTNTSPAIGSYTSVVSASLNKGKYIAMASATCYGNQAGGIEFSGYLAIGTTIVSAIRTANVSTNYKGFISISQPIQITSDNTTVALYAQVASGTATGVANTLSFVRIAGA